MSAIHYGTPVHRASAIAVCLALLLGVAGAAVALHGRSGAEVLRLRQSQALNLSPSTAVSAASVQAVLRGVPEPAAALKRTPIAHIRCAPGGSGPLGDPWSCQIRYRSGTVLRYRVTVQPGGSYRARGSGVVEGCCIKTPATQ